MLASLLPGLRDVRTPLTVGYLYLLGGWLLAADRIPRVRPPEDGLVSRLFDLSTILGPAAVVAALSFGAYVLGALLSVPIERGFGRLLLYRLSRRIGVDARQTDSQLAKLLDREVKRIEENSEGQPPAARDQLRKDVTRARRTSAAELRVRLLVANQEMYGEYDRLSAEAEFRLNICLPLTLLGAIAAVQVDARYAPVTILIVSLLAYQGVARRAEATSVLSRAVLSNVMEHPLQTMAAGWD